MKLLDRLKFTLQFFKEPRLCLVTPDLCAQCQKGKQLTEQDEPDWVKSTPTPGIDLGDQFHKKALASYAGTVEGLGAALPRTAQEKAWYDAGARWSKAARKSKPSSKRKKVSK